MVYTSLNVFDCYILNKYIIRSETSRSDFSSGLKPLTYMIICITHLYHNTLTHAFPCKRWKKIKKKGGALTQTFRHLAISLSKTPKGSQSLSPPLPPPSPPGVFAAAVEACPVAGVAP